MKKSAVCDPSFGAGFGSPSYVLAIKLGTNTGPKTGVTPEGLRNRFNSSTGARFLAVAAVFFFKQMGEGGSRARGVGRQGFTAKVRYTHI